jgi:hypothetical protein
MIKNQPQVNGSVFIIPNPSFKLENNGFVLASTRCSLESIYYQNSELNPDKISLEQTRWIQCWFLEPSSSSSNWQDHGIESLNKSLSKKDKALYPWRLDTGYVPDWVFDGKQEGDIVTLKMPVRRMTGDGISMTSMIKLSVKLDQLNYRYSRFGRFEDVLKKV